MASRDADVAKSCQGKKLKKGGFRRNGNELCKCEQNQSNAWLRELVQFVKQRSIGLPFGGGLKSEIGHCPFLSHTHLAPPPCILQCSLCRNSPGHKYCYPTFSKIITFFGCSKYKQRRRSLEGQWKKMREGLCFVFFSCMYRRFQSTTQ